MTTARPSTTLRALKATVRQAGLTEENERDIYERVTGLRSAKAMTNTQRKLVLNELKRLYPALKPASKRPDGRKKLTGKYAPVLQAYWMDGWNLGVIANRDDAALEKFVKRQTGLDAVRFCHHIEDADKAIEAIKGWLKRETPIVWNEDGKPKGRLVAEAQWQLLAIGARDSDRPQFWPAVFSIIGKQSVTTPDQVTSRDWITVMNALGERIRAAKAARKEVA